MVSIYVHVYILVFYMCAQYMINKYIEIDIGDAQLKFYLTYT